MKPRYSPKVRLDATTDAPRKRISMATAKKVHKVAAMAEQGVKARGLSPL
jgi:hypothetical protein